MKSAVVVFPGSNCDRDVAVALAQASGHAPCMLWHRETEMPPLDLIVIPGGFSYGDYLRPGAMAAHSPVMREVQARAAAGVAVLGICNGFQVLCEAGLLPGVLMHNAGLRFICKDAYLRIDNPAPPFTGAYGAGQVIRMPIAHNEGNYFADAETLDRLEGEGRIAFRYVGGAPNGAARDIAGISGGPRRNVVGLMPHPERAAEAILGREDGRRLFEALLS